jgi:hypothetical protein
MSKSFSKLEKRKKKEKKRREPSEFDKQYPQNYIENITVNGETLKASDVSYMS